MKFIAYDPNSGEKLSLKEHIHHMDKYTTYVFFSDEKDNMVFNPQKKLMCAEKTGGFNLVN
ncbi:hypothetical protein KWE33_01105 [Acinetobacter baumannii]